MLLLLDADQLHVSAQRQLAYLQSPLPESDSPVRRMQRLLTNPGTVLLPRQPVTLVRRQRGPRRQPRVHVAANRRAFQRHLARCCPPPAVATSSTSAGTASITQEAHDEEEHSHSSTAVSSSSSFPSPSPSSSCTAAPSTTSTTMYSTSRTATATTTITPCPFPGCRLQLQGQRHVRRHLQHTHYGRPLFPCAGCRFTCHRASTLRTHMRRCHASVADRRRANHRLNDALERMISSSGSSNVQDNGARPILRGAGPRRRHGQQRYVTAFLANFHNNTQAQTQPHVPTAAVAATPPASPPLIPNR